VLELGKFGREVVGIEPEADSHFAQKAKALGIPVIAGNARLEETLISAGVKRADAIIPCTDDELTNLDIALNARELNPDIKVVLRMFDPELAERVEKGFGIHTAFSTSALAAPIFAAAAMRVNVQYSFYAGETLLNLSELVVAERSPLIGQTVAEIEANLDLSVVCRQCGTTHSPHPEPGVRLAPGDRLLVLATLETIRRLNALNES
jgi:Trk K+ transport system NAD-binding subunit